MASYSSITSIGYDVVFDNTLTALGNFIQTNPYSNVLILTDRNTNTHCLPVLQAAVPQLRGRDIIEIDPGEEHKNTAFGCVNVPMIFFT